MYGLTINSAMDAGKIHHRTTLNSTDSFISGHLLQLCSDIFSKTINSFVRVHRRVKFAVNLQILSLAKFDAHQGQNVVKDCNSELISFLSNGCISFDEAMLSSGRQQKERALNASPSAIYKTRPELSLDSSKLCRSELVDVICSSLNSIFRRITFLDHLQSFSEPGISYSDLLRMFSQNLSRAFNRNQNRLASNCVHHSEDHLLASKQGKRRYSVCAVTADQSLAISSNTFSSRFSERRSERNTCGLMQSETKKNSVGLNCSDRKAECTKAESLVTDTSCDCFHMTAADKSAKVSVTQNSDYLDKNVSDSDSSHISLNDAIPAMMNSSDHFGESPSYAESTAACDDKKADSHLNLKLPFSTFAKDVNCAEGQQRCLENMNSETDDDDDDLVDGTCDEVTDEENTDEEETDEDELTDDESNSANSWDEETTDEETTDEETDEEKSKQEQNDAVANTTSAAVKTFCKLSFFVSPSEMNSPDSSSDSDDEDDDLEVDGWDSSEDQSSDTICGTHCDSVSFNGLYFPNTCSAVETKLSLDELKDNDRTRLMSASGCPSASTIDCSLFDTSCDDIVFCDDHESLSYASDDDEDLPSTTNLLSRVQSITARWNHFYSSTTEIEERPTQCKKQVRFARDSSLVTTYAEAISEADDYAAARKGPWEEYARDRDRFTRRIRDTAEQISWVLSPNHRSQVYKKSFCKAEELIFS